MLNVRTFKKGTLINASTKKTMFFINARIIKTWSLMKWMRYRYNENFTSYLGISRFSTILEKKLLRQFATSVLPEITFLFSIKLFFSLDFVFSNRKGFIVCQNFLLSVIFFTLKLAKYFFSFRNKEMQKFLCLV